MNEETDDEDTVAHMIFVCTLLFLCRQSVLATSPGLGMAGSKVSAKASGSGAAQYG